MYQLQNPQFCVQKWTYLLIVIINIPKYYYYLGIRCLANISSLLGNFDPGYCLITFKSDLYYFAVSAVATTTVVSVSLCSHFSLRSTFDFDGIIGESLARACVTSRGQRARHASSTRWWQSMATPPGVATVEGDVEEEPARRFGAVLIPVVAAGL